MDFRLGPFSIAALKGWPAARKGWLLASSASWAKPWRRMVICEGGMVQAPGLGHAGQRRIEGQAVCRPRGVEHRQDVPRVRMHSNLGEKTSRAPALLFAAIL